MCIRMNCHTNKWNVKHNKCKLQVLSGIFAAVGRLYVAETRTYNFEAASLLYGHDEVKATAGSWTADVAEAG